ncbi:hypothetical protein ACYPKM_00650 [Pseudomonas aeruginosa]
MKTILDQLKALIDAPNLNLTRLVMKLESSGRTTFIDEQNDCIILALKDGIVTVEQPEYMGLEIPVDVALAGTGPRLRNKEYQVVSLAKRRQQKQIEDLSELRRSFLNDPFLYVAPGRSQEEVAALKLLSDALVHSDDPQAIAAMKAGKAELESLVHKLDEAILQSALDFRADPQKAKTMIGILGSVQVKNSAGDVFILGHRATFCVIAINP